MLDEFFEIRVYSRNKIDDGTEKLIDTKQVYDFPSDEQIENAINESGGDCAEVVKRYELVPFA